MKPELVSGSHLWQSVFLSFAAVFMLFQVARGWRLGLFRQLVRIAAVIAAYSAAIFGGGMFVSYLQPMVKAPDFVLSAIGGAILALIVYAVVNTVGAILFKSTAHQSSGIVRLVYGFSGAFIGFLFGLFFLWLLITGIRSVGAIAEAQVGASAPTNAPAPDELRSRPGGPARRLVTPPPDENSLVVSMARLKKSIEMGKAGEVVKQTDVLPSGIYDTLTKVGQVFAKPEQAARFLSYPGVAELTNDPKILALRADPEITRMIEEGRLFDLIQDDRLIEAANDPALARRLKKFDLKKALDYAAEGN